MPFASCRCAFRARAASILDRPSCAPCATARFRLTSAYPLPNHRPLKLGKRAGDLDNELSRRLCRVDGLLAEIQIDANILQVMSEHPGAR
jgi:hypothetical protein